MNQLSQVPERGLVQPGWKQFTSWDGISQSSGKLYRRFGLFGLSFCAFVLVPTVLTFFYTIIFASNQFESETRFAVRSPDVTPSAASDALSMIASFTGIRSTLQDAYIIADYIRSRTIIDDLGGKAALTAVYSRKDIDWISRLKSTSSLEDALFYWRKKVQVAIDTQSNIITLRVLAFNREDAKSLAQNILKQSEVLVNDISLRSRRDAFLRAEAEVQQSMQRLGTLRAALLNFRNSASTIDPLASAGSLSETLAKLSREKILLETNIASLKSTMDSSSPTVKVLVNQIAALDRKIAELQSRLTGQVEGLVTFAGQLAAYEELKLQSQFAEKLLEFSQASLARARREQERQQLYIVTIVDATSPEEARYPRPLTGTAIAFAIFLVLWSMTALIVAAINDHAS